MIYSKDAIVGEKTLQENLELVKEKIRIYGEVLVIGDNEKEVLKVSFFNMGEVKRPKAKCVTLVEALERVLISAPEDAVHVDQIVNDIASANLYFKKDGSLAKREDIRATAQNYPQKFECLKGNYIKLKMESGVIKIVKEKKQKGRPRRPF